MPDKSVDSAGVIARSAGGFVVVHRSGGTRRPGCPQGFRWSTGGRQAARYATTSASPRCPDLAGLPRLRRGPGGPAHRTSAAQLRLGAVASRHLRRFPAGAGPRPRVSRRPAPTTARSGGRRPVRRLPARRPARRELHRRCARPRAPIAAGRPPARPQRARQRHHPSHVERTAGADLAPTHHATTARHKTTISRRPATERRPTARHRTTTRHRTIAGRRATASRRPATGRRPTARHRTNAGRRPSVGRRKST